MAKVYAYYLENTGEKAVVDTWPACQAKTRGQKARYKSFATLAEAKAWLDAGALYAKGTAKKKKKKDPGTLPTEEAIYFDAGTGRGIGTEVRLTDKTGRSLLEEGVNEFGNIALGFSKTNNYGELLGMAYAIELAMEAEVSLICGDSKLVIDYWSKGYYHPEKLEEETVALIQEVVEKRKYFESFGGRVLHVSGDINPADLGFHK